MTLENEADKNKITRIFEEYKGLMFHVAKGILSDHASAEDAVSDSLEKIIKNLHKIDSVSCYKTRSLIVIIIRNTAINHYNRMKRIDGSQEAEIEKIADASPQLPDKIVCIEGFNNIVSIINSLPDTLRDVAKLWLLHEWSYKEIADLTGISYDNVRVRVSRARKAIKNMLANKD